MIGLIITVAKIIADRCLDSHHNALREIFKFKQPKLILSQLEGDYFLSVKAIIEKQRSKQANCCNTKNNTHLTNF